MTQPQDVEVTPNLEKSMMTWLKDNMLALLVVVATAVGAYTLAVSRIAVLEVKVEEQEKQTVKTDLIIENNTTALNKISVIFAEMNGKLDTFDVRISDLEKHKVGGYK